MSPEQVRGSKYAMPADIWSFGCLIYEIGSGGTPPFRGSVQSSDGLFDAIENKPVTNFRERSPEFNQLMQNCLKKSPDERYKIDQILADPYLTDAENCQEAWKETYQAFIDA